ncbi:hypothetical protein [Paraburkholderia sp. SOS3]|uniref:hypothetical protein n=1 Tax=Paraburkholderia sp. SOS3 TaxID=1926494 RepID=UPI0009476BF0|nr:hypothetical protein [Paraburkholderia sp. SOS3]APR39997.1 hypothetical protein BTO02_33155 [Paraburkholderia sp. SOS3]
MNAPTQARALSDVAQGPQAVVAADVAVDMFTERGFVLANRIAKAYASSDAVPAQFRSHNLKRVGNEEHWVENPAAVGNCLVAIEVARAVRMSITAVMQNADPIEGKLRWSGKFVIAAINASGRFTPLRFQAINRGRIKATYKEKTGWDKEARRPIFAEREVEVDDIECIAWALPKGVPEPHLTPDMLRQYPNRLLDLYRSLGMPVVESAPVTMKMAVEEGWYGKPGSKWQTELRALMFQYRAGSFFGNIHAPDIVMGMGRTSEEELDIIDVTKQPDGTYAADIDTLRRASVSPAADRAAQAETSRQADAPAANVEQMDQQAQHHHQGTEQGETTGPDGQSAAPAQTASKSGPLPESEISARLNAANSSDELNAAIALIADVPDPDAEQRLTELASTLRQKFERAGRRASRGSAPSVE